VGISSSISGGPQTIDRGQNDVSDPAILDKKTDRPKSNGKRCPVPEKWGTQLSANKFGQTRCHLRKQQRQIRGGVDTSSWP